MKDFVYIIFKNLKEKIRKAFLEGKLTEIHKI